MIEDLLPWLFALFSGVVVALVSYFLGNRQAKNDMKLERRTEIFEDMLRVTSNLVDKRIVEKEIKKGMVGIKKSGLSVMFDDLEEDGSLVMDEMKEDLRATGMDEKEIDYFIKKYLLSLFTVVGANISIGIIEDQTKLHEEVTALGMYVSKKMMKKKSYDNLRGTAEKFNDSLEKFEKNKIDEIQLRDIASELSSSINELMKFQ